MENENSVRHQRRIKPSKLSPSFIHQSNNMLQKELQKHTFPRIDNDIRTGQQGSEEMEYSVIANTAQKSHDHSKTHSIAAKEVMIGDVRDVVIGGNLGNRLKIENTHTGDNTATGFKNKIVHKKKSNRRNRKIKDTLKELRKQYPDFTYYTSQPQRLRINEHRKMINKGPSDDLLNIRLTKQRSSLAVDGPFPFKVRKAKKRRCRKSRCKQHSRSNRQHSSVSERLHVSY